MTGDLVVSPNRGMPIWTPNFPERLGSSGLPRRVPGLGTGHWDPWPFRNVWGAVFKAWIMLILLMD